MIFTSALRAQIEVSVPFNDGFIGKIGSNTQQANDIQRFSTLSISKAFFIQSTASGRFESQGNDVRGTLRLQLTNNNIVNIAGALVWRVNSGNNNHVLGFVANSGVSLNLNSSGGPNYAISGGTANGRSNFGFKLNNSTYNLPATGSSISGNAANVDVSLLNNYLNALNATASPNITSFSPSTAGNGETVIITGTGFTGVSTVKFGNTNATSFVVNSDTQITAVVGSARSGDVFVQNSSGTDSETGFIYKIVQYNFENNVLDETASNLDGTISGAVTYGAGYSGQAVCFNRTTNNWIVLPNDLIRNLSDFTISLRFKTSSKGVLLGYQNSAVNGSANQYIPIIVVQSDGKLRATLWTTANRDMSVVSTSVVNDGNWHKIDMSITPTSINIYLDGALAGSTSSGTVAHL